MFSKLEIHYQINQVNLYIQNCYIICIQFFSVCQKCRKETHVLLSTPTQLFSPNPIPINALFIPWEYRMLE